MAGIILAHLSDTHFDTGARSEARARQVMAYLEALPGDIDAVVVTGDITHNGLPAEHEQAAKVLMSSRFPVYTCMGNHDGYTPYRWPLNQVHEIGDTVLLLCDSVILGRDDGRLGDATLNWLSSTLDTFTGRTVLVGMHHPPVELGHPLMDGIKLSGEHQLADLLDAHPNVAAVLCGHAHSPAVTTFAGRPLLVAPGVASSLCLPWEVNGELTWKTTVDYGLPPALAWHIVSGDGRVTTHFRLVPD